MNTFSDLALAPALLAALEKKGYTVPTPIQEAAIPLVLAGADLLAAAQTGTGKTAAFALPLLHKLLPLASTSTSPARHPVRVLVLAPTRELTEQVAVNFHAYALDSGLRTTAIYGGVPMPPQQMELRRGVEVVIATPGRLLDHLGQKNLSLSQVETLVLDEADRMLDMGFMPDLKRILDYLPSQRQTLLFSATFNNDIRQLAEKFLKQPQEISVAANNTTADRVEQAYYQVKGEKTRFLEKLLHEIDCDQVLVFVRTKISAGQLARQLDRQGFSAQAIHGDRTQTERLEALEAFKRREVSVLVATDVASRGLDISSLPCVINFDLPMNAEDYVHRIGRTGRAGQSGLALSLVSSTEDQIKLGEIEQFAGLKLEQRFLVGTSAYSHTAAHQAAATAMAPAAAFDEPLDAVPPRTATTLGRRQVAALLLPLPPRASAAPELSEAD